MSGGVSFNKAGREADKKPHESIRRQCVQSGMTRGESGVIVSSGAQSFFPFMMPSLATFLTGMTLVIFVARMEKARGEERLLAIASLLAALTVLPRIMQGIGCDFGIQVDVPPVLGAMALFAIPLAGNLIHAFQGRQGMPASMMMLYAVTALVQVMAVFAGPLLAPALKWFAPGAALFSLASALSPFARGRRSRSSRAPLASAAVMSGAVLIPALVLLDVFLNTPYDPLGFAFIPLLMISAGLFAHEEVRAGHIPAWLSLVSSFIIAIGLMPIIAGMVFIAASGPVLPGIGQRPWLTGFLVSTVASLVLCAGMAVMCHRKAKGRVEVVLASVLAMLCAVLNLRDIMGYVLQGDLPRVIIMNDTVLALSIGAIVHLADRVSGRIGRRTVYAFYGTSALMAALMLDAAARGVGSDAHMTFGARVAEHFVFIGAVFVALALSIVALARSRAAETDRARRDKVSLMIAGYGLTFLLLPANIIIPLVDPVCSVNFLAFVPMSCIFLGVFHEDILRINAFTRRQILSDILRGVLVTLYLAAIPLIFLVLKDLSAGYIVSRIIPYGIPPLLSFASAAFLSLFVLGLEKNRTETFPFSLICFCYAALNLDILLVGIIPDVDVALLISRIDHFFLVLIMLGANFQLIYLITGKRDRWWVVYLAYLTGIVMAPLTMTDQYFQGMYQYYWGFFAKKAVLYDVMSVLWMSAVLYAITLLFTTFRKEEAQRRTLMKVLIAFLLIAALSLANTPAIYGFEIYPLGTFIFIALFFLTYGLFKFNLAMAMQYIRALLFWSGLVLWLMTVGLAPLVLAWPHGKTAALPAGILLVAVLYTPIRNAWDSVLNLFIRKADDILNDRYRQFTERLSHIHHLNELHDMVKTWVFEVFDAVRCTTVFCPKNSKRFMGWTSTSDRASGGLFGRPGRRTEEDRCVDAGADEPLIRLCSMEHQSLTQDELLRKLREMPLPEGGLGGDAEIVLPIVAHDRLVAMLLVGGKTDGSRYTTHERELLDTMGLFLGPHVENAMLLENLEQEVEDRTKDLNDALVGAMIKEKEIVERNLVIERQNQVMAVLLDTSTRMHQLEGLDDIFSFTLAQLRSLFPDLRGGIILEGARRGLIEASAFAGVSDGEQKIILESRGSITQPDAGAVLAARIGPPSAPGDNAATGAWKVFPLQERAEKAAGYMILNGRDLDGPTGETIHLFIAQISAVVQNRLLLIHLERMASTDGLTGVYNRTFLDRELDKSIKHARRFRNMWFSLMIIDVNGLKQINDTYGHGAGDTVIVNVAELLKSACRETDIVARIGGDEFAVLMPSTNRIQAEILKERIRAGEKRLAVILTPSDGMHVNIPIRISIGLASSDEDDPESVMKVADDLMYLDKQRFYEEQAKVLPGGRGPL
jgi:diguanylate cyclase (GGDEF)-like protein